MNNAPRGTVITLGSLMLIENAYVEEVNCFDFTEGYIVVSYTTQENNNPPSVQMLQLNLNNRTAVLDASGQSICLCCIQKGSLVNAVVSSRTTRSMPPQANAYLIAVQRNPEYPGMPTPPPPIERPRPMPSATSTGRIIMVDFFNNFFVTEDPNNPENQVRYNVNDTTTYINRRGNPIMFRDLQPDQLVRVTHARFQTSSIPPQTAAYQVQLL